MGYPENYSGTTSGGCQVLNKPRPVFSERIVHIDPIYEAIFAYSTPEAILRTQRTCRAAHAAVSYYLARAYKSHINRTLRRYFPDPLAFRSLQARTATLISGSTALQFFDRTFYPDSDLDLYVYFQHGKEIGHWLQAQGYTFEPLSWQARTFDEQYRHLERNQPDLTEEDYVSSRLVTVLTFVKSDPSDTDSKGSADARSANTRKVQVIVGTDTPMSLVFGFHSTCVMNVISYEKAYCLFPRATLEDRLTLVSKSCDGPSSGGRTRAAALSKYAARGWDVVGPIPREELTLDAHGKPCGYRGVSFGPRWINDAESWVIPLDTAGLELPPAPGGSPSMDHDPVALCNWATRHGPYTGVMMYFKVLNMKALEYQYLLGDRHLMYDIEDNLYTRLRSYREASKTSLEMTFDAELPKLLRECRSLRDRDEDFFARCFGTLSMS